MFKIQISCCIRNINLKKYISIFLCLLPDSKGTFHEQMGTIKDRNSKDLTEAEEIKKRWQEYTEELYKKGFYDPDNPDGVITDLEPDTLE